MSAKMDILDVKRDLNLSFMEENNEEEIEFGFNCVLCTEKFQNMQDAQKHFVGAHKVHEKNIQNQEISSMPNDQEVISLDNEQNSFTNSKNSISKGERSSLSKESRDILKAWVFQHISNHYPTEYEKNLLAQQTGLTVLQGTIHTLRKHIEGEEKKVHCAKFLNRHSSKSIYVIKLSFCQNDPPMQWKN